MKTVSRIPRCDGYKTDQVTIHLTRLADGFELMIADSAGSIQSCHLSMDDLLELLGGNITPPELATVYGLRAS